MKKTISLFLLIISITACNHNDSISRIDEKKLNEAFLNPSLNKTFNEKYNVTFNSNFLNNEEIEYLKKNKISEFTEENFNRLRGFTIYYDNSSVTENKSINKSNVIALSIYEFDNENEIVHRFYLKKNQTFEEKFSLKENVMNTSNQVFLLSYYFPKEFKEKNIGINNFCDINEASNDKNRTQRNEFNLFKVVAINKIKSQLLKNNTLSRVADPKDECVSCQETGKGVCDSGLYCNGETPICEQEDEQEDMVERGIISQSSADILFNKQLYYDLRDDLMSQYNIGEKYIDYYYAISGFLQKSDYNITTLYKMMTTLPEFNDSIEKLLNNTTSSSEIIIDTQLKNDMLSIVNDLKAVSQNNDYQTILTELENDIILISNKSKSTLLNELQ
jgi:hypothetical protein